MWLSLGQRANRIVSRLDAQPQPSRNQKTSDTRKWSSRQLEARWGTILLKIELLMRVFQIKNMTKILLGEQNYLRLCGKVRHLPEAPEAPEITKVIQGEVVGKQKAEPGDGEVKVDPDICQHPEKDMKRRGNRKSRWWTCDLCQTRWERRTVDSVLMTGPVGGNEILLTEKYLCKTFNSVMLSDPSYCQHAVASAEQEPSTHQSMRRFAQYIAETEAPIARSTPSQSSQTREATERPSRTRRRIEEEDNEASSEESFRMILGSPSR